MGGAPGSNQQYGNLAQRANPNMADPMQNMNPNGFPRGRNTMGGAQGGAGGPGAPGPMGRPMPGGGGAPQPFQQANMRGQGPMRGQLGPPPGSAVGATIAGQQRPPMAPPGSGLPPGSPMPAEGIASIGLTPPGRMENFAGAGTGVMTATPFQAQGPPQIGRIQNLPPNVRQVGGVTAGPPPPGMFGGQLPSAPNQPPGMGGPGQPRMVMPPGGQRPQFPGLGGGPARSGAPGPPMPNRMPPPGGAAGGAGPVGSRGGGK